MSKKMPSGTIKFHSYLSDVEGCGTLRCIIPSLLLNSWSTDNNLARSTYSQNYIRDVNYYKNLFFVIFQRAATKENAKVIEDFSKNFRYQSNCGVIYEVDDLLKNIPTWNFASEYYNKCWPYIEQCMKTADGLTVSTQKLKDIYSKHNSNIQVIPNHLAKFIWGDIPTKKYKNKKFKILWAGSENHFNLNGDEGDFGNELINYIKKTKKTYEWIFIGGIPNNLRNDKNITHYSFKHILEYPRLIKSLNADIAIAPLKYCVFNECKSNIKMLEYVASGIPAIYSNIEPYKDASLKANNDGDFIDNIEYLYNNPQKRKDFWKKDYNLVKNQLFWEENNNLTKYISKLVKLFGLELV